MSDARKAVSHENLLPRCAKLFSNINHWIHREYRTLFHLGRDWQLHESTVSRLARRIEDILLKSGMFALQGKKRLLRSDAIEYTIVDVTESLIERPKKTRSGFTAARKSGTIWKRRSLFPKTRNKSRQHFSAKARRAITDCFSWEGRKRHSAIEDISDSERMPPPSPKAIRFAI